MSEKGIDITTGVGRIVWGHPTKSQTKKHQDGPNKGQPVLRDGQPVQVWAFGVSFPKAEFQAMIWPAMAAEAATGYQNIPPRFAWKYQDGDGVDSKGQPFNKREGYAGCFILTVSSEFQAPPIFKLVGGAYQQLDGDAIKCGDYVAVGLNIKVNVATGTNTPSLYVNPRAIEFVGFGTEIVNVQADPNAIFKGQQHALPPGATAAPMQQPGAPIMPGMGAPMQPAPMSPAPLAAPMGLPAPVMAPPPLQVPQGPQRPLDPSHIAPNPAGGEFWWNGAAWAPAPVAFVAPAPMLPPPAHDFVAQAMGMPQPQQPMQMPGMMPPR